MPFNVLFVCTGNICRSPLAERLFRDRVGPSDVIEATSAGTAGLVGHPMDAPSAQALRELGGDPLGHSARRLAPGLIRGANIILTAESAHRSAILQSDPLTYRRVFTLREFGRLGAALPPYEGPATEAALTERVAEVAAQRGLGEAIEPGADDIADPIGGGLLLARRCAGQIAAAVDELVDVLLASPDPTASPR